MKKFVWFMCAAMMLTALMFGASLSVSAEVVEGACGDTYNYDTDQYDNVKWSFNTETGVMTVFGEGKMGSWFWGEAPWYSYRNQIKSVVIEEGVTHISNYSFTNHTVMTDVSIPASVTSIGGSISGIFEDCDALTSVHITDLAAWCRIDFSGANSNPLCRAKTLYLSGVPVTELTIPNDITVLKNYVFCNFEALTKVTLPDGLLSIGKYAFADCTALTEIHIPDSVRSVGEYAFSFSDGLIETEAGISYVDRWVIQCDYTNTEAVLRADTVGIADAALRFCSNLKTIHIPSSLRVIGDNDFHPSVIGVYITDIAAWCNIDFYNSLSNPLCVQSVLYVNGEPVTDLIIPQGVTDIGRLAFYAYGGLLTVTLPESVLSIGDHAFGQCKNLISVEIPSSVISVGNGAFKGCEALTGIDLPEGVVSVGEEAFYGCSTLKSVTVPRSLASIGKGTFNFCNQLTSVYLTDIGAWCSIILHDRYANPTLNGTQVYLNGDLITALDIPNGVTSVGDYAFYCFKSLTTVTLPDSVTAIGNAAFSNCENLKSIRLPDGLVSVGNSAFYDCKRLESIALSDSVTAIGIAAFRGCATLTRIDLPPRITVIENSAFAYCNALTSIRIPIGVTSIGSQAFYNCTRLESVAIPHSVTSIGESAFSNCKGLKALIFCGTSQQWQSIKKGDYWLAYAENSKFSYHNWNDGAVTEEHTSSAIGKRTYTCVACGETKDESIGHSYGDWTQYDDAKHQKVCACGDVKQFNHVYSNAKDTECNDCGYVRTVASQPAINETITEDSSKDESKTDEPTTDALVTQDQANEKSASNDVFGKASGCHSAIGIRKELLLLFGLCFVGVLFKKKYN